MSERDYLAKEEALRRLSEPEGDHELHTALERMRLDHPHLWGYSTGCTSPTMPTPQGSRSGEGHPRVAGRTPWRPIMMRPCASCRCRFSSFGNSGYYPKAAGLSRWRPQALGRGYAELRRIPF